MLPLLPVAWQTTVNTFYQSPLKLRYEGLEPTANYSVEVVYSVPNIYVYDADQLEARSRSTPKPLVCLFADPATASCLFFPQIDEISIIVFYVHMSEATQHTCCGAHDLLTNRWH